MLQSNNESETSESTFCIVYEQFSYQMTLVYFAARIWLTGDFCAVCYSLLCCLLVLFLLCSMKAQHLVSFDDTKVCLHGGQREIITCFCKRLDQFLCVNHEGHKFSSLLWWVSERVWYPVFWIAPVRPGSCLCWSNSCGLGSEAKIHSFITNIYVTGLAPLQGGLLRGTPNPNEAE